MLSIMILICAADVERSQCTQRTALTVTAAPATNTLSACGLDAQSLIASRLQLENGQYVKVVCTRGGGRNVEARLSGGN